MADEPIEQPQADEQPQPEIEPVTLSEDDIQWLKEQRKIKATIKPDPEPDQLIKLESLKVTQAKIEQPRPEPDPIKPQPKRKPQPKQIRLFRQ